MIGDLFRFDDSNCLSTIAIEGVDQVRKHDVNAFTRRMRPPWLSNQVCFEIGEQVVQGCSQQPVLVTETIADNVNGKSGRTSDARPGHGSTVAIVATDEDCIRTGSGFRNVLVGLTVIKWLGAAHLL